MTVTFSDIAAMLAARPPLAAAAPCHLVKNITALKADCIQLSAEWTALIENLAQTQQKHWPQIRHPRVALYVSNYGKQMDELQNRLLKLNTQQDALTRLCGMINADLRVYELDLTTPVNAPLGEVQACHAISYGLMSVEEHVDCLVVETLSPGVDKVLQRWAQAMAQNTTENPLTLLLQAGGGDDLFALLGAVFAARMAKVPVFGTPRLDAVLQTALARLLADDDRSVYCTIPQVFAAPDVVQTIGALQNLQFILALGPQTDGRAILPQAA